MTWYDAVLYVLKEKGEAMHYADIADAIVKQRLRDNVGATPNQTVSVVLNYSLKHEGAASPFVRISRGIYGLSGRKGSPLSEQKEVEDAALTEPAADEELPAIGAFGMYWRRDLVRWPGATVHLMGRQSDTSKPVDFSNQVGVYLLHDRDRIIYVGRVDTNERLGPRLREHTKGRLAYRWDRFSWFGLRRPTREGKLAPFQRQLTEADLVGLMESILIEAIEPGLNRKRGEGLRSVEFYQAEDPSLQKDKKRNLLVEMMQQLAATEDRA
jgi:hypothetical protein